MTKIARNTIIEDVEIIDTSAEGKAVARYDNMVIFCDGGVPGDIVDVHIFKKKINYRF